MVRSKPKHGGDLTSYGRAAMEHIQNAREYARRAAMDAFHKDGAIRSKALPLAAAHPELLNQLYPGAGSAAQAAQRVSETARKIGFGKSKSRKMKGGSWNDFLNTLQHPDQWGPALKNEFTNPQSDLANEFLNPTSDLRSKILPAAAMATSEIPGLGEIVDAAQSANAMATRAQQAYAMAQGMAGAPSAAAPAAPAQPPPNEPTHGGWASSLEDPQAQTGAGYSYTRISHGSKPHSLAAIRAAGDRLRMDAEKLRTRGRKEFSSLGHYAKKDAKGRLRAYRASSKSDYEHQPDAVLRYYGKLASDDILTSQLKELATRGPRDSVKYVHAAAKKPTKPRTRKATSYLTVKAYAKKHFNLTSGKAVYAASKLVDGGMSMNDAIEKVIDQMYPM